MSEVEFGSLSLRGFLALLERRNAEQTALDRRAATICAVYANCHRDPKRRAKPFQPADFMPGAGEKRQTPDDMLAVIKDIDAKVKAKNAR